MRASILLAAGAASLAISVACADSEFQPASTPAPAPNVLDAEATDASAPEAAVPDTSLPRCSAAGWCITDFPDADLDFIDIWPFEDRAFAIAKSRVENIKILEWQKSTDTWQYIDDKTQNDVDVGTFAAHIYAPSEDEIYFAVGPAFVFHGKRATPPETKWTWTRQRLPDNIVGHAASHDHGQSTGPRSPQITLGVWGTGADDVYAYYSNTIFRREPSDGSWVSVYEARDIVGTEEHILFTGAAAMAPDDIWFVGARDDRVNSCPIVVRKTVNGWTRIADGTSKRTAPRGCSERPGFVRIGDIDGGWLVDIQPKSGTEILALHTTFKATNATHEEKLTRMRLEDGGLSYDQSVVPVKIAQSTLPKVLSSLWHIDGENWFTAWGLVLHGAADDTFTVSTLSRDGAPIDGPMHQIRGTSKTNLWAIGARHAFHKTTP